MTDPLSLAEFRLHRLRSRVKEAKTNRTGCELLVSLAQRTLSIFHELEATHSESSMDAALELISDALGGVEEAAEKCCNTAIFTALLYNETYTLGLNHAAGKLVQALNAVPPASLEATIDLQTDVDILKSETRNASFEDEEATSHKTQTLKDALERKCYPSSQDFTLTQEDHREESSVPTEHEDEAKKDREKKQKLELKQTIDCASETLDDMKYASRVTPVLKDCFHCPISKQFMKDPVVLKDSGMTYDRESIEKWLEQGHQHDPITKIELLSRELVSIPPLTVACQATLKLFEANSTTLNCSQEQECQRSLEPGLYEGHGELFFDSRTTYTSQLLIVDPNGEVIGCTLYEGNEFGDQENNVEIGVGTWDGNTKELSLGDNRYKYHGSVEVSAKDTQSMIEWNRYVFTVNNPTEEHASPLVYFPLSKRLAKKLDPTILQMEGTLELSLQQVAYKSKLVLSLEVNSTIGGWIYFESRMQQSKIVGQIVKGSWEDNGRLSFSIHIPMADTQSEYVDAFHINGLVSYDEILNCPTFTSIVTKERNEDTAQSVTKKSALLNGVKHLEYQLIHEVSMNWHDLHPRPLRLFQMPKSVDSKSLQGIPQAKKDVDPTLDIHAQRATEGSSSKATSRKTHADVVKKSISKRRNIDYSSTKRSKWGLHNASQHNDVNVIKELMANGAEVNLQDNERWTPLHTASAYGHIDVVKELIANDAKVNLRTNGGWTPLYIASQNGYIDVVKELITNGAEVDLQMNDGRTPLHTASNLGHIDVVKELIANCAEVNLQKNNGWSPLYIASQNGHIDVAKELIANGANVNLQKKNGWSSLHIASHHGHINVVKELIANGAEVNLQENNEWSPLNITSQNGHINVVKELILNGADVNLQENNGASPLYIASQNGHVDVVKELIANGAEVNLQKKDGWTPLHIASENGHIDVVKELMANGGEVNLRENNGASPLHIASQNGHIDVVKELISNGVSINHQGVNGASALHIASNWGRVSIVQILLEHGALKGIRDNDGKTPYDVVCTQRHVGRIDNTTISELKVLLKK